jgi:hypothetical protein
MHHSICIATLCPSTEPHNTAALNSDHVHGFMTPTPSILPLPQEVVAQIKSSTAIGSLTGVVLDLFKNALDARATHVDATIDFARGACTVEDDGLGIPPIEFGAEGRLGQLYCVSPPSPTSACATSNQSPRHIQIRCQRHHLPRPPRHLPRLALCSIFAFHHVAPPPTPLPQLGHISSWQACRAAVTRLLPSKHTWQARYPRNSSQFVRKSPCPSQTALQSGDPETRG